jgi:hypothetical protein
MKQNKSSQNIRNKMTVQPHKAYMGVGLRMGSLRPPMVPYGPPTGPIWPLWPPLVFLWLPKGPYGPLWTLMGPSWTLMGHYIDKVGPYGHMGRLCSL